MIVNGSNVASPILAESQFQRWDGLMATSATRRINVEEVNDVAIATFVDKKILDETNIQIIGN